MDKKEFNHLSRKLISDFFEKSSIYEKYELPLRLEKWSYFSDIYDIIHFYDGYYTWACEKCGWEAMYTIQLKFAAFILRFFYHLSATTKEAFEFERAISYSKGLIKYNNSDCMPYSLPVEKDRNLLRRTITHIESSRFNKR